MSEIDEAKRRLIKRYRERYAQQTGGYGLIGLTDRDVVRDLDRSGDWPFADREPPPAEPKGPGS